MMKKIQIAVLMLAGAGVIFAAGTWVGWRSSATAPRTAAGQQVLSYTCPMHPAYHSDKPGECPSCGMRLEPVYAEGSGKPLQGAHGSPPGLADVLQVSPQKQQAIGVQLGQVQRTRGSGVFRTTGRVAPDETRLYRLNASTDFWIREVFAPTTGSFVRKNDRLLSFYSPNFLSTAASYMYALDTVDRLKASKENSADQANVVNVRLRQAVDALRTLGVSDYQMDEMARTRQAGELVTMRAPVDAFVLSRNATRGQYIQPGTEIYQFVDLSRVWILADVFESLKQFIRPGVSVDISPSGSGQRFEARVGDVALQFDESARTLKVRIETGNPGFVLRPGMFVDVEFNVVLPPALVVQAEAVVDTGLRRTVFVDRGNGYLEPRQVETGWRIGDQVEIVKGLMEGEKVVVSGTFLIDSESRMRAAAQQVAGAAAQDPVCGMTVDEKKAAAAGRTSQYQGRTYYFCADDCKKAFDANPAKYAAK